MAAPHDGRGPEPVDTRRRWRDRDHTRGRLLPSLMVLALPQMLGSGGGVVFALVDLTFISRLGEAPMAAVIVANQSLRQTLMLLVMGASFGAQALIARAVGEGNVEGADHAAGQCVLLGGMLAAVVALGGGFFPELLFSLPNPDPDFYAYGVPYVRLIFLLNFGMVGMMLFNAILGGAGDTTTPLFVMLLQISVALFAEWCLIFGHFGAPALGVRGAALGVVVGQMCAMGVGIAVLFRGTSRVHLRRRHLAPDFAVMRRILRLAWPPALQMVGNVFMTVAFLRIIGRFGGEAQAAFAIGLRLTMVVPMICFPLAGACATLVGQNLGAGRVGRAWGAVRVGLLVHGTIMWSFALAAAFFRHDIVGLFSDDPEVVRLGGQFLGYAAAAFVLWAFYFVFMRSLQGAGDVFGPMTLSLINTFLVSVPLTYVLATYTDLGPAAVWIGYLTSSAFSTLATGAFLATRRRAWRARAAR